MKTTIVSLVICLRALFSISAFGKSSKEVPKADLTPNLSSTITLDAKNIAASRSQGLGLPPSSGTIRITTTHTETVEIHIGNISTMSQHITVQWFWLGRYEKSKNWFRSGDGDKTLDIDPKQLQTVFAENTDIKAHDTKGRDEHYKSGGNLLGWIVIAYNSKHEIQAIKASDHYLDGFAASPPPKQRQ